MHEIPRLEESLPSLDDEQALAGEDKEVLLRLLGVVHAVRLARPEDADADTDFREAGILAFERGVAPEPVALEPARVANVENKPALTGRAGSVIAVLERSLGNHGL